MNLSEILVILVVALVVFGPEKLPKLAFSLGKILQLLRRQVEQVESAFDQQVKQQELINNIKKAEQVESQNADTK